MRYHCSSFRVALTESVQTGALTRPPVIIRQVLVLDQCETRGCIFLLCAKLPRKMLRIFRFFGSNGCGGETWGEVRRRMRVSGTPQTHSRPRQKEHATHNSQFQLSLSLSLRVFSRPNTVSLPNVATIYGP